MVNDCCELSGSECLAARTGVGVSTYGREAPVAQALPSDLRSPGAFGSLLKVIASFGEAWLNRFHWSLVPSSTARSPTVRFGHLLAAAFATIEVTLNSIVPVPRQPCAEPYLRLPTLCAV
ncbi:hypothetical protein B5D80_03675 [Micromonospora wenchangensis]|uniref:Uncharacterized protein n=1 Tax=Micromonospora wenchangensis TaxID=1185415 RepID=A0A246RSC5_9ACTN|nr:hypothetical protein B5D80_03675 [Micromonospora wenchangensis]